MREPAWSRLALISLLSAGGLLGACGDDAIDPGAEGQDEAGETLGPGDSGASEGMDGSTSGDGSGSEGSGMDATESSGSTEGESGTGEESSETGGESSETGGESSETDGESDTESLGPEPSVLSLSFAPIKQFEFTWTASPDADFYRLLELDEGPDYVQLGEDLNETELSLSLSMPLHAKFGASYVIQACNALDCTDSEPLVVVDSMVEAIGYFKGALNGANDATGSSVALSADGRTLVVGAPGEQSLSNQINGDAADDSSDSVGAAYVFILDEQSGWKQEAYLKASNAGEGDRFGIAVDVDADGSVVVVGAQGEESSSGADPLDDSMSWAGAVYVFRRDPQTGWEQEAYLKAPEPIPDGDFGRFLALSGDGKTVAVSGYPSWVDIYRDLDGQGWTHEAEVVGLNTTGGDEFGDGLALDHVGAVLAVGAPLEDDSGQGINAPSNDDASVSSGAAYVFRHDPGTGWAQEAFIKATYADASDHFGTSVSLSADGTVLAVGSPREDGGGVMLEGMDWDNSLTGAGAVYVYRHFEMIGWQQEAYVKASNPGQHDHFGNQVRLSPDGGWLVGAALWERSNADGVGGDMEQNSSDGAGAVYVYHRFPGEGWAFESYVKAANSWKNHHFGLALDISEAGSTLAAGAPYETGTAQGIQGELGGLGGDSVAGAVYLY